MTDNRISSADAKAIQNIKIHSFEDYACRKVDVRAGQYYKIIADSPDSAIAISNVPIEGFMQAEYNCRIGKVSGIDSCATCIFPDP